jgi:predicted aspartyl protease
MLDDRTQLLFPPSGQAEVPLHFAPEVLRCVAAGPGGRPLTVLIDTGTDPSAIDLQLARRLGLRIGAFALGSDAASDAVPFTETVLPWLRLGALELRDLYLLAVDLSQAPFEVDLVLGYNVLCRLGLTIDYQAGTLALRHPDLAPPEPSAGGVTLPLHFYEHFPALTDLRLAETINLPLATIDTGSNGALTLGPDLAAQAGLYPGAAQVVAATGHGFTQACDVLRSAASLRLGPYALSDVELDAPSTHSGDLARHGRANIGNRLLARFRRVTLDYRRGVCVLEPAGGAGAAAEAADGKAPQTVRR